MWSGIALTLLVDRRSVYMFCDISWVLLNVFHAFFYVKGNSDPEVDFVLLSGVVV